jgi:hypothetical protein
MKDARSPSRRLRDLFAGQIENAFYGELGLADPELTSYLCGLLSRFVHVDAIFPAEQMPERRIDTIERLLARLGRQRKPLNLRRIRSLYRYIGDFSLFWAGLYPEAVRMGGRSADPLAHTVSCGKRSYLCASQLSQRSGDSPSRELLQRLSTHFELCAQGLQLVRRGWRPQCVRFRTHLQKTSS